MYHYLTRDCIHLMFQLAYTHVTIKIIYITTITIQIFFSFLDVKPASGTGTLRIFIRQTQSGNFYVCAYNDAMTL